MPRTPAAFQRHRVVALLASPLFLLGALAAPIAAAAPTDPASAAPVAAPSPAPTAEHAPARGGIVADLQRHAHPIRSAEPTGDLSDLEPISDVIGDADIVGLGEATHGSHDFRTMGHRVFRYLVEEEGFRTFVLEFNWSSGLKINDYVQTGRGNPRQIIAEEMQDAYVFFATDEAIQLIEWMRQYNEEHPEDPVSFLGNDLAYPGVNLFDDVADYVDKHRPELRPEIDRLYAGIRPTTGMNEYLAEHWQLPQAQRDADARRAEQALRLVKRLPAPDRAEHARAVQQARVISQVMTGISLLDIEDPDEAAVAPFMRHRDRSMAANTAWVQRQSGDGVLLYAHNGHVAYQTYDPVRYPKMQGAFLEDWLGDDYVSLGTTFNQGSFWSQDIETEGEPMTEFTVGPAEAGNNEHTLSRVSYPNYLIDLRETAPATRRWLREPRPTWLIGTAYPVPPTDLALGRFFDGLIHLDTVRATDNLS